MTEETPRQLEEAVRTMMTENNQLALELDALKDMDGAMLSFELVAKVNAVFHDEGDRWAIINAGALAARLHRHQVRSTRKNLPVVPYIEHPLRNALRLLRWGVSDRVTVVAALLHDVVEDCAEEIARELAFHTAAGADAAEDRAISLGWIKQIYGAGVATVVEQVSNSLDASVSYLEHLVVLGDRAGNLPALLVKAADLVDNAGSLPHQHGEVSTSFIAKKIVKYVPAIVVIVDALHRDSETLHTAAAAAAALEGVLVSLDELAQAMITEGVEPARLGR